MKLSTIFELLLIFLLIAFAAYGRVIDSTSQTVPKRLSTSQLSTPISLKQATENVNKYCVCNENICNCCRDFHIPLVQLSGPGCASLQYLQDNKLAMQLSIGDNILSSNIVNGKDPKPVCVTLPGGFSKFCGKIYSIKKEADKHFKACLGLELRSASELEASLRVSCFRFGPDGLKLRPAEPLPATFTESSVTADDDYDDIFGLDDDDEDDDDDDDDEDENDDLEKESAQSPTNFSTAEQQNSDQAQEEDEDEDDLLGLSALLDIFTSDDDTAINKKPKPSLSTPPSTSFTIPILALTPSSNSLNESHPNLVLNEASTTFGPISHSQSTPTSLIHHDDKKTSPSTSEIAPNTTIMNDETNNPSTIGTLDEDYTQTPHIETNEKDHPNLEAEKVKSGLNNIKTKINSTEIKLLDKKRVDVTTPKTHGVNKINKMGIKQQITDTDDSSELTYDEGSDEDDQISEENNNNIKQIEAEDGNDKTVNSDDAEASDIDYDQSYEESDEDEDEDADVEVMSTLLDDEITTETSNHRKHKIKINKLTNVENVASTTSDYDYELSEILGRKYSKNLVTKGIKRKSTYKNRQHNK